MRMSVVIRLVMMPAHFALRDTGGALAVSLRNVTVEGST